MGRPRSDRPDPVDPEELRQTIAAAQSALEVAEAEFLGPDLIPGSPSPHPDIDYAEVNRLLTIMQELAKRQQEALRIYEPLPRAQLFHADLRPERLLRGSNRAGKTLAAAVECSRAVGGVDPFHKYPERDGRFFYVAKDGKAVGQVVWRKLGRFGAFRMVRDLDTGAWRSYRPWQDQGRPKKDIAPSPPLIPPRLIAEISWENKKENIPSVVMLRNGWELTFFSSLGEPPNGVDIDAAAFDEEIINSAWYAEIAARLLDREGRFWWAATPQNATEQLFELHQRAEDPENPEVGEHILLLEDNPHISDLAKQQFAAKMTAEERRIRIGGEFALTGYRVYPDYSKALHTIYEPVQVPLDWTRYLSVDPGRQRCGVLFLAISPEGKRLVYDELYIRSCTAKTFGIEMEKKCKDQDFEAFLIDHQAGRIHDMGSGGNVELQYSAELKDRNIRSHMTGWGFAWGSPDPKAGIEAVHDWLRIDDKGQPGLGILAGRAPNLEHEFERYSYKPTSGKVKLPTDEPVKRNDHLMDCLRYLAMYHCRYVKREKKGKANYAVEAMRAKAKKKRDKAEAGARGISLGPRSH